MKNQSIKIALFGNNIKYSLSPYIHNFIISKYNLNYTYILFPYNYMSFKDFLYCSKNLNIHNFNITMPFKIEACKYLDASYGDCEIANSTNTIIRKEEKLIGYSTDGEGFAYSLLEKNISLKNKNILIFGCGGSSSSLITNITKNFPRSITVLCRNLQKASYLLNINQNINIQVFNDINLKKYVDKSDIIINCTPLGMKNNNFDFLNFDFLKTTPKIIYDLIYSPTQTNLLKNAQKFGHTTINGLAMLIYQAILALQIFTNTNFSILKLKHEINNYLTNFQNK